MADFETKRNLWRLYLVFGFCLAVYLALIARLAFLQINRGEQYKAWAQGLDQLASKEFDVPRGEIAFRGGQPLAINKNFTLAFASPPDIKDLQKTAAAVSSILSTDQAEILKKISKNAFYALLKEKISDSEAAGIKAAKLPGIYLKESKLRYYPQANLLSQVVGFVDNDGQGRYGLEEYYNEELAAGKNLVLNIDYQLQYQAEKLIAAAVKDLSAAEGEVIVADPKTGAIYAMAQVPNFDPNNYQTIATNSKTLDIFKNKSTQELFEPGSVFKAVTMASALNDNKVTPQTSYVDTGIIKVGGSTIYNFGKRSYGEQTMTGVLEKSINTGAVFAENQLGNEAFARYIEQFGIMEPTGIDLPETYSQNLEFKKGYTVGYYTAAFGQGIWMTTVQLVRAYSALANNGALVQPSMVQEGRTNIDLEKQRQVVSPETAQTLAKMLVSVVDNGFGKPAKILGYSICGKTGTAEMSWSTLGINKRGYSDATTQSFIGWFPADNPKFLILVKMINPQAKTAEYSVIPVFHDLAQYAAYLYQVPPDRPVNVSVPAATVPSATVPSATVSTTPPAVLPGQSNLTP